VSIPVLFSPSYIVKNFKFILNAELFCSDVFMFKTFSVCYTG